MTYVAGPQIKSTLRLRVELARTRYVAAQNARRAALFSHATTMEATRTYSALERARKALANA